MTDQLPMVILSTVASYTASERTTCTQSFTFDLRTLSHIEKNHFWVNHKQLNYFVLARIATQFIASYSIIVYFDLGRHQMHAITASCSIGYIARYMHS